MPITRRNGKYYWGSKGPFDTQAKAEEVAQAAYASGYKGSIDMQKQDEYGEYERYKKILENSPHGLATLREHHLGHKAIDQLAQEQLSDADFGGERRRIHVINWWDREHQMHPYNDWQRSGKRTRQTNKPYNPDAQIGLWDFHRNYLEDFIDYHNDQQKPGKIGGTAWENYGGEGAHPATSDLNNLKRVTERMMQQGIYNPHDVEDVPEDFPQYKAVQKLLNFVQKAEPEEDDELDAAAAENRREFLRGNREFQRYGPIDHSKEKGSLENPRDVTGHWRDEGVTRKKNEASGLGGMPRQFPVQQEGGTSGPVTGATHRYGTRDSYDTSNALKWEEVKPSSVRERARMGMENSIQKLMSFVQKADDEDLNEFAENFRRKIEEEAAKNRPHSEWADSHPDLLLPIGHKDAPFFLDDKGAERQTPSIHYHAYNYLDKIHRDVPMTAKQHADGLKRVHRSDMLQRHGKAVRDMDYDDAFPLGRAMPNIPPRNAPKGQKPSQEYLNETRKEMNIHDFLTDHTDSMLSTVQPQHQEGVKRMFDKVAFESPSYKPTSSFETDPDIQQYFSIEQSLRKVDDGPPEYHPVTGQRINAPTSGGKMGPNLTPSHIGGELEQQTFPKINSWHDNVQSQAHLSEKERAINAPGYTGTPKKYEKINSDWLSNQRNADGSTKDHSLLVDAELGHDRVDNDRAGSQWVPGRFIGRELHDGAYHQSFAHQVLDELYGRTHHGNNHSFKDLTEHMGSEYRGEYRDVYSHHPHNEHLEPTGEIINPLNGEPLNLKTYHGQGEDKSNRNPDNSILDNIPGSLTDSHQATFGNKEGWAWTNHGLFQRAIKRGEKMRFSTWLLGFALGAEHINANNDVPYGFNSFGNRISPSSHRQDSKVTSELHRPVKWEGKDGETLENKPLLHYSLPHSMDRKEEAAVRQLDTDWLPPGLQSHTKMSFLDDFGPMDIHQALDLIENPNHDVDPGRVRMTRIDPSTGAKIERAFPELRNPMKYQHDLERTEEGKANQRPGDGHDWDDEHVKHYFSTGLDGRLFGNFLPEQDPLSRFAQLQYHDGLRGLWNTENPETGGHVFTEEDYHNRGVSPWMTYSPETGERNFPIRKAPYFINPADPFGRGKEDKPSQQGGGYGDEVKDVLSSPNISSDPMSEFAPRGRQERQPQFHRPWGINYNQSLVTGKMTWPEEAFPNIYAGDKEAARAQQFQLKPPAPLKGGPGGHLSSEPLHFDNAAGTSDKREFDRYLHKLSNGEKMPSWEHWLGLVRGADYHNHNADAVNNFTQDEAQHKRLGHWNRSFDEDRDMGILGQDRARESIEHPHIVINRGTIPRNYYSYHTGQTYRQLAPSEESPMGLKPNAPKTSSGGMSYAPLMTPDDVDFGLNSKWHHGGAIEPPENTPMYGIPWPFHNIRGIPKVGDDDPGMNVSQEDTFNPEVGAYSGSDYLDYPDDKGYSAYYEPEYKDNPITLRDFLSLSGPKLQQGIDNSKFQGHPWVEGESPLTTDTTGEPGMLRTDGENKDWDNLLDARWQAWVSYLNHVLEHEPDHTGYFGPQGESDPRLQKLFQLRKEDSPMPRTIEPENVNNMGLDKGPAQMMHGVDVPGVGNVGLSNAIKGPGGPGFPSGRTMIVATLPNGERQSFYSRTGSGGQEGITKPGDFSLFDGHHTGAYGYAAELGWFDKGRFFSSSKPREHELQRYGTEMYRDVAQHLDKLKAAGRIATPERLIAAGHAKLPGIEDRSNHGPWSYLEINNWLGTKTSLEHNQYAHDNRNEERIKKNWEDHNRHRQERGDRGAPHNGFPGSVRGRIGEQLGAGAQRLGDVMRAGAQRLEGLRSPGASPIKPFPNYLEAQETLRVGKLMYDGFAKKRARGANPRDHMNAKQYEAYKEYDKEYKAGLSEEKSVNKLSKFIRKEGDGGGAFNGLSDTVFTSTNAGIFSPTYGGDKTQRRHEKRHKAQEKKRKKLLGKDKKSGVDRLVQFLYDGSPNMSKARKMGLAPGLDDDMTGDGATGHAWNNKATQPAILNHKKTSRPLEDAMKIAEKNEPHINMGLPGGMETGITATYPQHSSVNSVGNAKTKRKQFWGKDKSYVQKAVNGVTTMISPDGNNESADGPHPQRAFIERTKDNPNEAPAKDAVIKENDMQRRVKKYDDKASRRDGGQEQPAGSMAAAGSAGYPSGATMQMAYTSDYGRTDALHRGGDQDMDDPEVVESGDDASTYWVPEAEKGAKLEAMRKELEEAGDETPILNALLKVDYA